MKNKKLLSLLLCAVMLLGMLPVTAHAESELDAFGRLDDDYFCYEWFTYVKGGDIYSVITDSKVLDRESYPMELWVDGVLVESMSGGSYTSHTAADYGDLKTICSGSQNYLAYSGHGVMTDLYIYDGASAETSLVRIVVVNTYLAEVQADYSKSTDSLALGIYETLSYNSNNDTYSSSQSFRFAYGDVVNADLSGFKAGDMVCVTMTAPGTANGVIRSVAAAVCRMGVQVSAYTVSSSGKWVTSITCDEGKERISYNAFYDADLLINTGLVDLENQTYDLFFDCYGYLLGIRTHSVAPGDAFGRLDDDYFCYEWFTYVKGGDIYSAITDSKVSDRESYPMELWVDGVLVESMSGGSYTSHTAADYGDLKKIYSGSQDYLDYSGRGVMTDLYIYDGASTEKSLVRIVVVNTYLAEVQFNYNKDADSLALGVYEGLSYNSNNDTYSCSQCLRFAYGDVIKADLSGFKVGDMVCVTMTAPNTANGVIHSVAAAECKADAHVSAYTVSSSGKWVTSITCDERKERISYNAFYDADLLINTGLVDLENQTYDLFFDPYGYLIGIRKPISYALDFDIQENEVVAVVDAPRGSGALLIAASYDDEGRLAETKTVDIPIIGGKMRLFTGITYEEGRNYKLMLVDRSTFAPLYASRAIEL